MYDGVSWNRPTFSIWCFMYFDWLYSLNKALVSKLRLSSSLISSCKELSFFFWFWNLRSAASSKRIQGIELIVSNSVPHVFNIHCVLQLEVFKRWFLFCRVLDFESCIWLFLISLRVVELKGLLSDLTSLILSKRRSTSLFVQYDLGVLIDRYVCYLVCLLMSFHLRRAPHFESRLNL